MKDINLIVDRVEACLDGFPGHETAFDGWTGFRIVGKLECGGKEYEVDFKTPFARDLFGDASDASEALYDKLVKTSRGDTGNSIALRKRIRSLPIDKAMALADWMVFGLLKRGYDYNRIRRELLEYLADAANRNKAAIQKDAIIRSVINDASLFLSHTDVDEFARELGIEDPSKAMEMWEAVQDAAMFLFRCGYSEEEILNYDMEDAA